MTMTLTSERQADAAVVAARPVPAVNRHISRPAGPDISRIPSRPAELLAPRRSRLRAVWHAVAAVLSSTWDVVMGSPATEHERWQRKVADAREYSKHMLLW